ncbi:transmembrane sensor [Sphingosinicella soli]|uniref:Transmembrane sensor n=2 Tax=Sphingosinicella soli TaxID=333708 RepID=A0A7W7F717_9SPHN|nr:transmembrane sensor [Sphingosinicella soli]
MDRSESSAEIDAAASRWAVRTDHAPLSRSEQTELDAWLSGDIRRRGAFARAQAMLIHARRTTALGADFDPDAYLAAHRGEAEVETERFTAVDRRRFLRWGGSAAATAAVALTAWFGFDTSAEAYATTRGEVRLVPLHDGSQMTLNTATRAEVRFTQRERQVVLSSGEALFDVAGDAGRPFVVIAGNMTIRAIGTSFTVRRLPDRSVQVLVREGVVELRPGSGGSKPGTRIAANTRAVAVSDAPIRVADLPPAEVSRALAWREGMLSFEDETLADAAAEFARYSDWRISFADPALGGETITGLYSASNPRGFARAVALSLNLEVRETAEGTVLVR